MTIALPAVPAFAAPTLTISPVTWNVVGLDSNTPATAGPDTFPIGARVCNTSTEEATNVVATFEWISSNSYVTLADSAPISRASIAAGTCGDYYFQAVVTRTSAAFNTARRFVISAIADGMSGPVSTPTPREVFVEKLVSQNRNSVDGLDIAGACTVSGCTVYVGQTYTITLDASTATQGYEQLEAYVNLPGAIFEVQSITQTYTAGSNTSTIYADACSWRNDPTGVDYRSCSGTGKAGGTIVSTYVVKVIGAGSGRLDSLVYDFSGSSYHYNDDFGSALDSREFTAVVPGGEEEEEEEEEDDEEEEEQEEEDDDEQKEEEEEDDVVVNGPPVARNDAASTPYTTPVRVKVRANDDDPEDDVITITTNGPASNGEVACTTSCLYTPRRGFAGADTFHYIICDPHDGCDSAKVRVTVRRPSKPPIARDEEVTSHGGPVSIKVIKNDEDPYGDVLSLTENDVPEFGTADCKSDGMCLYTPQAGFSGVDSFDYKVCTEVKSCASATATVNVLGTRLARTGADLATLTRLALMFMLAGGVIVGGARLRPAPARRGRDRSPH